MGVEVLYKVVQKGEGLHSLPEHLAFDLEEDQVGLVFPVHQSYTI